MAVDVLQRIQDVRTLEEQVRARRAQAEANLALAKKQLEQTETDIRALGVEPDVAEQELATLEAKLERVANELTAQLSQELASCDEVMKITNEALK